LRTVHVIVPDSIDDPARPSGGNAYDRRLCDGLGAAGWDVHEHQVAGRWPWPDPRSKQRLALLLDGVADGGLVLADGLIASSAPDAVLPQCQRLRLVVLVHMLLGDRPAGHDVPNALDQERAVLSAASAVVTTSHWTRQQVLALYGLASDAVQVAEPGVDAADLAPGTSGGGQLLCVATVAPHKGHDLLLAALARIRDLRWRCTVAGSLDRDPAYVEALRVQAAEDGVADRVRFVGVLTREMLASAYAAADVLVLPSRGESYGMVVTEALARGLPVIATEVGGVVEAMDWSPSLRPGLLVPQGDPQALAGALTDWLRDPQLRRQLREAAGERRGTLTRWDVTTASVARVLEAVA
jgi:glycosyltransferase involved in cell wall biosynthesis